MSIPQSKYTALTGGVGGAKLALGLTQILPHENMDVIVNTGDDFEHLGLCICPDIDTLIYTLSGLVNTDTGWGLNNESWDFMQALSALGGDDWFRLGDRDLATHVKRTEMLAAGLSLSQVTDHLATMAGVNVRIHPMSDSKVRTHVDSADGRLGFQEYFVRLGARPVARAVQYLGGDTATAAEGALRALTAPDLAGIILCPSNPWLSIAPILSVTGLKSSILQSQVPTVAVSPIVAGKAIKGPAAKLMDELGVQPGVAGIAQYYQGVIDGLVIDQQDRASKTAIEKMGIEVAITDTIMNDIKDKKRLASFVIDFVAKLGARQ